MSMMESAAFASACRRSVRGVQSHCCSSFMSAEARALGRPVSVAAAASAANSRDRDMPSTDNREIHPSAYAGGTTIAAASHTKTAITVPSTSIMVLVSRQSGRARPANPRSTRLGPEQTSMAAASRRARCATSWARTASSSRESRSSSRELVRWMVPRLVQAVAVTWCSTTTSGGGMSARMQSRRTSSDASLDSIR